MGGGLPQSHPICLPQNALTPLSGGRFSCGPAPNSWVGFLCGVHYDEKKGWVLRMRSQYPVWPDNKRFAFTIFDDTDLGTLANLRPVYSFLRDLGILTTKSVWPLGAVAESAEYGDTCENPEYLAWLKELQAEGFEIALHNASFKTSKRARTAQGLEVFKEHFSSWPKTMVNHAACRENIYWGANRVTGSRRVLYNLLTWRKQDNIFRGHLQDDPLFWGDYCKKYIQYVRNFVFADINTLKVCPFMPYHDPEKPFVNYWFCSSDGKNVEQFNRVIVERNQAKLEKEGGLCIMYTHFGKGFFAGGRLNSKFEKLMRLLASKNGWFVPVSTVLDFLRSQNGGHRITGAERAQLEWRWLCDKLFLGPT